MLVRTINLVGNPTPRIIVLEVVSLAHLQTKNLKKSPFTFKLLCWYGGAEFLTLGCF